MAGSPIIFWEFEDNILPQGCEIEQSISITGDECHHNIKNLPDKQARKIIIQVPFSEYKVCSDSVITHFNEHTISM